MSKQQIVDIYAIFIKLIKEDPFNEK